jgi:hypothetical protein
MTANLWGRLSLSMARAIVVFSLLCVGLAATGQDARTIIQRSAQANEADWTAATQYNNYETDQEDGGPIHTYEVMMILGSPYKRLIAMNGVQLSAEQQTAEQRKLEQAIARRHAETPEKRAERIAKWEKDRKRDHQLMAQLTEAFDFKLVGQQRMGPFQVYVLKATPRAGYRPPNTEAQVLTGMEGKLWIDVKTFQWVKVQAKVIHPVSIEGFLATVEPGTYFLLEKAPVGDGIWEPTHFSMKSHAKVLFFFNHRNQENDVYFGYRRANEAESAQVSPGTEHHRR